MGYKILWLFALLAVSELSLAPLYRVLVYFQLWTELEECVLWLSLSACYCSTVTWLQASLSLCCKVFCIYPFESSYGRVMLQGALCEKPYLNWLDPWVCKLLHSSHWWGRMTFSLTLLLEWETAFLPSDVQKAFSKCLWYCIQESSHQGNSEHILPLFRTL